MAAAEKLAAENAAKSQTGNSSLTDILLGSLLLYPMTFGNPDAPVDPGISDPNLLLDPGDSIIPDLTDPNSSGTIVDSDGNPVTDADGNPIKPTFTQVIQNYLQTVKTYTSGDWIQIA